MIRPRKHLESIFRTKDDAESRALYLRLDKNERLVPLSDMVYQHFQRLLTPDLVMAYPDLEPLYQKLAQYLGVNRAHLYLSAGSDLGIKTVYETYVNPGDRVVIHAPSYAMHEVYAQIYQAQLVRISCTPDLNFDVPAFLDAITPGTRLVIVESPNGFTGSAVAQTTIESIVQKAEQCGAIVLLDEAYYLFSRQNSQTLYTKHDNVIISRTFSKDLGLAGLRCAYLLSQSCNIDSVYHVKPMHEINSVAAALVLASLAHPEHIERYVQQVHDEKHFLKEALRREGIFSHSGDANFLVSYVGTQLDMSLLLEHLKRDRILIRRPPTMESLKGWVRVSIGTHPQMQRFITIFMESLKHSGWALNTYEPPSLIKEGKNL